MKKIFVIALCFVMVMGIFAACNGNTTPTTGGEATNGNNGDQITLSIGLPVNVKVEDYETNAYTRWLEETTGYNLEFVTFTSNSTDYKSQLSTRLNDLPDILWNFDLGESAVRSYGEDGYFIDLTEYYEDDEFSGEYWERVALLPEDLQDEIKRDLVDKETEEMYSVPRVEYSLVDRIDYQVYINQTWLDQLGLEMPTDPESLYTVLKAFKENDLNGNGDKTDEIPLLGYENGFGGDVINWIVNMFIYTNDQRWWNVDENGKLYSPFRTDEYREALKFIDKLIDEGLLYDTTFAGNQEDMQPMLNPADGVSKVGIWTAHPTSVLVLGNEAIFDYVALPQWGCAVMRDYVIKNSSFITDQCEHPDEAFKLLMTMCSEEGSLRMRYGEKGVDWVDADEGTKSFLGYDAKIKVLNESAFNANGNQTWGANAATILIYAENEETQVMTAEEDTWTAHKMKIMGECVVDYNKAAEENNPELVQPLVYTLTEGEATYAERTNCQSWIKQCRSQFCTSKMDVHSDSQWESYLKELDAQGYETWLQQAQQLYDAQQG